MIDFESSREIQNTIQHSIRVCFVLIKSTGSFFLFNLQICSSDGAAESTSEKETCWAKPIESRVRKLVHSIHPIFGCCVRVSTVWFHF